MKHNKLLDHQTMPEINYLAIGTMFALICYGISAVAINNIAPLMLPQINYALRTFVCLYLILRFNPMRSPTTDLAGSDRLVVFAAAFLIASSTIVSYVSVYVHTLNTNI